MFSCFCLRRDNILFFTFSYMHKWIRNESKENCKKSLLPNKKFANKMWESLVLYYSLTCYHLSFFRKLFITKSLFIISSNFYDFICIQNNWMTTFCWEEAQQRIFFFLKASSCSFFSLFFNKKEFYFFQKKVFPKRLSMIRLKHNDPVFHYRYCHLFNGVFLE